MGAPDNRTGRFATSTLSHETAVQADAALFVWRGAGIVLIGEHTEGRWVIARGWSGIGQLTDVRRWSFDNPRSFGGQVRRLTLEATGDAREANATGQTALDWATTWA